MILRLLSLALLIITLPAYAQEDVKTLPEIVNPSVDFDNDGKPITALVMANEYYKSCVKEETLVYNEEEKQLLCACQSANMSEHLTVREFRRLKSDSAAGREARGKAVAYGFAPCLNYVLESKTTRDCMKSKKLNDLIFGKKKICACATNLYQNVMSRDGSYIIMDSTKYEPMSIDPMEYYFRQDSYFHQLNAFISNCRNDFQYNEERR